MKIKLIDNKISWEKYIESLPEANFLQSYNWGLFQQNLEKKVFFIGLFNQTDKQIGAALIIKEKAKRGNYLTVAGGPLIDWNNKKIVGNLKFLFEYIKKIAKKESCLFIRFRPQVIDSPKVLRVIDKIGGINSPMHLTADLTLQLDLNLSEEEILKQMRKNTRYEVRKSKKLGIIVKKHQDPKEIKQFFDHQVALAEKHGFVPFTYNFLYEQFKVFAEDNQVMLIRSYLEEKLLASAFVIFYNGEAVYHYGISTNDNNRLPGSYAVQWEAILEAKRRNCSKYNFWGIAPKTEKSHRFAGVSLFKRGFGGSEVAYLPAHDIAVSWQYSFTRFFEILRRKWRRL